MLTIDFRGVYYTEISYPLAIHLHKYKKKKSTIADTEIIEYDYDLL